MEKFFPFKDDKLEENIISESSYIFFPVRIITCVILNFYLYNKNEGKSLFEKQIKNSTPSPPPLFILTRRLFVKINS